MAFTTITLETRDRIGTLTLNRPEKLNAMNPVLIVEFGEALTARSSRIRISRYW